MQYRNEIESFAPSLPEDCTFPSTDFFSDFLCAKCVNGDVAARKSPFLKDKVEEQRKTRISDFRKKFEDVIGDQDKEKKRTFLKETGSKIGTPTAGRKSISIRGGSQKKKKDMISSSAFLSPPSEGFAFPGLEVKTDDMETFAELQNYSKQKKVSTERHTPENRKTPEKKTPEKETKE